MILGDWGAMGERKHKALIKKLSKVEREIKRLQEERSKLLRSLADEQVSAPEFQRPRGSGRGRPRHAPGTMARQMLDLIDAEPDVIWTADMFGEVVPRGTSRQSVYNTLNRLANSGEITQVGRGQFACNKSRAARRLKKLRKKIENPRAS